MDAGGARVGGADDDVARPRARQRVPRLEHRPRPEARTGGERVGARRPRALRSGDGGGHDGRRGHHRARRRRRRGRTRARRRHAVGTGSGSRKAAHWSRPTRGRRSEEAQRPRFAPGRAGRSATTRRSRSRARAAPRARSPCAPPCASEVRHARAPTWGVRVRQPGVIFTANLPMTPCTNSSRTL